MVLDSRQSNPANLAAIVHPPNFPINARLTIAIVNPQVIPVKSNHEQRIELVNRFGSPSLSKPRLVERPDKVKYCEVEIRNQIVWDGDHNGVLLTRGKNMMETISSSFSVRAIANPPSLGTIMPVRNAPVH